MLMLKIAFRNIFRQKRRTVLTALSMFGGFVLAAFFIGWADGTYNTVIDMFTRSRMGHIQIHEKNYLDRPGMYKTVDNLPEIETILKQIPEVDSWSPRLFHAGLASVADKTAGVRIIGINPQKENATTQFKNKLVEGRMFSEVAQGEVIIGKGLAKILRAKISDDVVVVTQSAMGAIADAKYKIIGIVDSGDEVSDRVDFYLSLSAAQALLEMEGRIHEIAITVHKLNDVENVNAIIKAKLNNEKLSSETWQEFAKTFYLSMEADKEGMYVMLLVIVLVVAVGVLNTVLMSVLERRREYGVLKAVGTRPWEIIKMVLLEVNCLGVLCIVAGTAVGLLANYLFSKYGIPLSEPMTVGGMKILSMHGEINFRSFYIPALTVILSATIVSIFPAIKAAHTDPAKTMRMH